MGKQVAEAHKVAAVCLVALFLAFGFRSPRSTKLTSVSTELAELRFKIETEHVAAMEADEKAKREIEKLKMQLAMQTLPTSPHLGAFSNAETARQDPQSDVAPVVSVSDDHPGEPPAARPEIRLTTTSKHQVFCRSLPRFATRRPTTRSRTTSLPACLAHPLTQSPPGCRNLSAPLTHPLCEPQAGWL